MKLLNYHNEGCKELLEPFFDKVDTYNFDEIKETVFNLFKTCNRFVNIDMWYVLILIPAEKGLFFAFTQELKYPTLNGIIEYEDKKIKVARLSELKGFHGWGNLTIIEGSFNLL